MATLGRLSLAAALFGGLAAIPLARAGDDYEAHIAALAERLPPGFTVVREPPFVVLGDEDAATVRARAERTIRWAVERLKAAYFARDPAEVIDVWLFRDEASYRSHAKALFGDDPDTPYGYYSAAHRALVMNIATGGGTLVHEIVHPFMRTNFPRCPAWFNEGLASLYEQSAERDGRIVGLTNWRLAGLKQAIRAGRAPSVRAVVETSDRAFYGKESGIHYAVARYLCYYLQEKGLLGAFYRGFAASAAEDPSGWETLRSVLGLLTDEDVAAFEGNWRAYVLNLRFP
jgi:hypothetical protein